MKIKTVILQGSSRTNGNTSQITSVLAKHLNADIVDLNTKTINPYSYEHPHLNDDFLPVMRQIINYDLIVFATPIYWYSMSGLMKNFFDRITDCLKVEKDLGRQLRGKKVIAVSCGSEIEEPYGFFMPFKKSSNYLGMTYLGNLHTWIEKESPNDDVLHRIRDFLEGLKRSEYFEF